MAFSNRVFGTLSQARNTRAIQPKPLKGNLDAYSFTLWLSPDFIGSATLFTSADDGVTWVPTSTSYTGGGIYNLTGVFANTAFRLNVSSLTRGGTYEMWDANLADFIQTDNFDPIARQLAGTGSGVLAGGGALVNPYSTPKLAAKIARIRRGLATQAIIAMVGDSTTVGAGAGSGGTANINGARANNIVVQLAALFTSKGIAARAASFFGDQYYFGNSGSTSGYATYDPRVTLGNSTTAIPSTAFRSLGGLPFREAASTGYIAFNPGIAWDTAIVISRNATTGTAALSINGGTSTAGITGTTTVTTTTASDNNTYNVQTVTITKASATLQIGNVSGAANTGQATIAGVIVYDSTTPGVNIVGLGAYGTRLSVDYLTYQAPLAAINPDCVIINQSINDINTGGIAGLDGYMTALKAMVGYAQGLGADVVIATPSAIQSTDSVIAAYRNAIIAYAATTGILVVDLTARQKGYTIANANGLMDDPLHPNAVGYNDAAIAYGKALIEP